MIITDWKSRILDIDKIMDIYELMKETRPFDHVFAEIGFGPDRFFIDRAAADQHDLYIGIEIKRKRVLKADSKIQKQGLDNAFIIWGEARETLNIFFPDNSLDGIYINFPDPYHKKRHFKRRLINGDFFEIAYKRLKQNSRMTIITDNEPYMEHILDTAKDFIRNDGVFMELNTGKGMPENYPMTEFAVRESKGKGAIQHLYATKGA